MDKKRIKKITVIVLFIITSLILLNSVYTYFNPKKETQVFTNYSKVIDDIKKEKIDSVTVTEKSNGTRNLLVTDKEKNTYKILGPRDNILPQLLTENNIKFEINEEPAPSFLERFLISWGPTLFFVAVWVYFMRSMMKSSSGGRGLFSFNKSKAQLIDPDKLETTFDDVVGCDEAKKEVQEFVDFFSNPEKFQQLGGRIPKGLLLTGPAGTGKTLLAKALAKQSKVPFYAVSGSEFVEMFVGVGASRVRDMFEIAKKAAPCVLFIDEIDAIGGKRSQGSFGNGGSDEREQTLNQILVEMDGMDTQSNIILVGATNRPEILDPALLRPGRFDRQVMVSLPDVIGRETIVKTHLNLKKVPISIGVDLHKIARGTPGFSGAELANLVNESAIFAARRNSKFVEQIDLENAKDKIMMGPERPSLAMSDEDKRDTAYHEAGHTIVAKLLKDSDPVYKVTIIPRGRALGLTQQLPDKDRFSYKKEYLADRLAILMGGRAAEDIFCNTLTTGASNDIAVATSTARSMVMEWGMSSLGPIGFGSREQSFLGGGSLRANNLSENTMQKVDFEVEKLLNNAADIAHRLLSENKNKVEDMTDALMEVETLDDWQIENIMANRHYNDNAGMLEFKAVTDKKIQDEKDRRALLEGKKPEVRFIDSNPNSDLQPS